MTTVIVETFKNEHTLYSTNEIKFLMNGMLLNMIKADFV